MSFGTIIEIIAGIFIVYGLFYAAKAFMNRIIYEKRIRRSVIIAVKMSGEDDDETRKLKMMCARQLSDDFMLSDEVYIINDNKEKE